MYHSLSSDFLDDDPSQSVCFESQPDWGVLQDCLLSELDLALYSRCTGGISNDYQALAGSQRGGVVQKANFVQRVKGNLQIISPLIFSSFERIETISTAMELRRFGKIKADLVHLSGDDHS